MPKNLIRKFIVLFIFLMMNAPVSRAQESEKAIFAGGCFWCMESAFEKNEIKGVTEVLSGFTDGSGENPTYKDYAEKGHVEVIEITYDPAQVSYTGLLDIFWRQIDPTDADGQFGDRGRQYRPAVFYLTEEQKTLAEQSKQKLHQAGIYPRPLVTEITKASKFYKAEEYHQDYHKKHPVKYKFFRFSSGRDKYLKKIWGDADDKKA